MMPPRNRIIKGCQLVLTAFFFFLPPFFAQGASFSVVRPLDFGHVIASPYGGQVTIDAASGSAIPVSTGGGWTQVTGGSSAQIRFTPDQPGQQAVMLYPSEVLLSSGANQVRITGAPVHSTQTLTAVDLTPQFLHVGGILQLGGGPASGGYSGTLTVTITVHNP